MKKFIPRRLVALLVFLAPLALLIAGFSFYLTVSAQTDTGKQRGAFDDGLRRARQVRLKAELSAARGDEFRKALESLSRLDEPGALDVWQEALKTPDIELRREAWAKYQKVRRSLIERETIPRVARIPAPADEILSIAQSVGIDANIWSKAGNDTVVAAPDFLIERLRREGYYAEVLYPSIADWQRARATGDQLAKAITPAYQSEEVVSQVRIAVVSLSKQRPPQAGYSDWLGDQENILMSNDSFLAYLDIFPSDGSDNSINSHIEEKYGRRGYTLAGFFTLDEFAATVTRFFHGKTFDPGHGRAKESDTKGSGAKESSNVHLALAEGKFHSYEETLAEFKALAAAHPTLARVVNLGPSFEGRQIFALKIAKDPEIDDSSKPDVLITGCHHAREWISVEPPVYFANQLIGGYETDEKIRLLVNTLQIWIVPIVNPDGLEYSQSSPNDQIDATRMWRKSRRPVSASGCANGIGVDLNRNYAFQWRLQGDDPCPNYNDDRGASDDPVNELYRGPKAESEPEIKAIKSLVDDPNRHFRVEIDYHNFSQLILYPWGYQRGNTPDSALLVPMAQRMSDDIFNVNGVRYKAQRAFDLYVTTGSSSDYAYEVNRVAAPIVVEMRPACCNFNVPESEIEPINRENWAGALPVLEWAVGPPILESVKAYQKAPGGDFSKLVYSANWARPTAASGGLRQLKVDTRSPVLEPGSPLRVELKFSKPMDTSSLVATLGRNEQINEASFADAVEVGGWKKTDYTNDTWIGDTVIPQDDNLTNAWQLKVEAKDAEGDSLDAAPATIASYATGTGAWQGYEDSNGAGTTGGFDTQHVMSPSLRAGFVYVFVGTPTGGERLAGGDPYLVTWTTTKTANFIPAQNEVWLSTNGGVNFNRIATGIPGDAEKSMVVLPAISTDHARLRVIVRGVGGNAVFGDNEAEFSVGSNVNSAVDISFISSELVDLNWSDTSSDGFNTQSSGSSRLVINLSIKNHSDIPITNPFLRVSQLSRNNVLLSRDLKSKPVGGARQSLTTSEGNLLAPGETIEARLEVGLVVRKKFALWIDLYGTPPEGALPLGSSVRVWKGKPKTKSN